MNLYNIIYIFHIQWRHEKKKKITNKQKPKILSVTINPLISQNFSYKENFNKAKKMILEWDGTTCIMFFIVTFKRGFDG